MRHTWRSSEALQRMENLILTLVLLLLTYLNKSAAHSTCNTFEMNHLNHTSCAPHTHKTTRILCLIWDCKYYSVSILTSGRSRNDWCKSADHKISDFKSYTCQSLRTFWLTIIFSDLVESASHTVSNDGAQIGQSIQYCTVYCVREL